MSDTNTNTGGDTPPPVLRGRVTDATGAPVPEAFVMFGGDSPSHHDIGQITNRDGVFFYPTLTPGSYTIVVRGPMGDMAETRVDVSPDAPQDITIVLGAGDDPMPLPE